MFCMPLRGLSRIWRGCLCFTVSSSAQSSLASPVTAGRRSTHAAVLETTILKNSSRTFETFYAWTHSLDSRHDADGFSIRLYLTEETDPTRRAAKEFRGWP